MKGLVISRVLQSIVVLWGVSIVVFVMVRVIPGDPVLLMAGEQATEQQLESMRAKLGLDRPIHEQYLAYMRVVLSGDIGWSLRMQRPVSELLLEALPATVQLALVSTVLSVLVGIPFGIISATRRGSALDQTLMVSALVGQALPTFWWGIFLVMVFAVTLRLLPTSGGGSLRHLILPAITLSTHYIALITRLTRSGMLDVLSEDYVRTARAKGLKEWRVVLLHSFRNAAIPIATVLGLQIGALLGGAVITETIFAWPGIGTLVVNAIYTRDYPIVQAVVLLSALVFVVVNMCVDLSYFYLDPRIRER